VIAHFSLPPAGIVALLQDEEALKPSVPTTEATIVAFLFFFGLVMVKYSVLLFDPGTAYVTVPKERVLGDTVSETGPGGSGVGVAWALAFGELATSTRAIKARVNPAVSDCAKVAPSFVR